MPTGEEDLGALAAFRQLAALDREVLVLSAAMSAFSLGFQMTSRYLPEYMTALGASALVVGLYGTATNVLGAVYPYPGGWISDRVGTRRALTAFGLLSTAGFMVWLGAAYVGFVHVAGVAVPPWAWIFVGLVLAQAWKSLGLGATFALVKQQTRPSRLARGFAGIETFRRVAFLVGPLAAAGLLHVAGGGILPGFLPVLGVAAAAAAAGTLAQHVLYDASQDTVGKPFEGVGQVVEDLRALPAELRPLLVGDTLVRFGNGMVYVFFVLVVTRQLQVGLELPGLTLTPGVFFGVLLAVEMVVALLTMAPAARLAEAVGLKPVVSVGFAVYALFPVLLIFAPADPWLVAGLFAFSGLRFAGLPAHKALIVGPAQRDAGGRVTGAYYLARNAVVIPSAALGGALWVRVSPEVAFTLASLVAGAGLVWFLVRGREFEAYA
jgi:MFS family permease